MRLKLLILLCSLLFLLPKKELNTVFAAPHFDTAYDIVNGVNVLRASYSLPALEINTNLMAAAQSQSDYQSSIETVTHLDEDGAIAILRAAKFGYGGGNEIVIAENVYAGFQATAITAVSSWAGNSSNLQNMIGPYKHIGAGVAIRNGVAYYTLVVGHLADDPGVGAEAPADTGSESGPLFIVATPRADGSIVHIVGFGHTLIMIAEKYGITVEALMALNNLTEDSIIFAGDELIIKLPDTGPTFTPSGPTFTPAPTTPTLTPTSTLRPTRTPRPTRTLNPTEGVAQATGEQPEPTPTTQPASAPEQDKAPASIQNMAQTMLVILIFVAAGLVLLGNLFDRRRRKE